MKTGTLYLVPTPLDDESLLEKTTIDRLLAASNNPLSTFVVEEVKVGRRRWIHSGLPREKVNEFFLLNEHTDKNGEASKELLKLLQKGHDVYLMSDGGLPAFCDPGQYLVDLAHSALPHPVPVRSFPFANSIALGIALSGFPHDKWMFEGFLAKDKSEREGIWQRILQAKWPSLVMDTPYRLLAVLEELAEKAPEREMALALDLSTADEDVLRGKARVIWHLIRESGKTKREFVLIIGASNAEKRR